MTDTDVATTVESAALPAMAEMDITDVYTLMDVQMRDRLGPRELYRRWEKQNWSAYDIDLTKDATDWQVIPAEFREQLLAFGLRGFFLGEAAVTDTLSPLVHAAPTDDDRQFLATQLVDEARHTVFFDRFFNEVIGETLDEARAAMTDLGYLSEDGVGYAKLFYGDLVEVTDAVRLDPTDYGKWIDGIVVYHMIVEGMLALTGQRQILQVVRLFGLLPGFRAGFTAVTRDESRHVNYGVYALRKAIEAGMHDRIVERAGASMGAACDVLTRPARKLPLPDPAMFQAMAPDLAKEFDLSDLITFPYFQLRKRLRAAGIREGSLDDLERQWNARVEENVSDYQRRFGEPHPALTWQGSTTTS